MPLSGLFHDQLLKARIQYLGFDAWELGGGGDLFFTLFHLQLGFQIQICVIVLLSICETTKKFMEHLDFERYGGYQCYCDLVGTCGFYVQADAEIVAT